MKHLIYVRLVELEHKKNTVKEISGRVRKMHELVRANHLLKQNFNPEIPFSISDKLVVQYRQVRSQRARDLKLSKVKSEREEQIDKMKGKLMKEGVPYWLNI